MENKTEPQDSEKVLKVWNTKNKIELPVDIKLNTTIIDRLVSFLATGAYFYFILDFNEKKIEYIHPNVTNILGIPREDIKLGNNWDLYHPDDLKKMHEKEAKAFNFVFTKIKPEEIPLYKMVYMTRLKAADENYKLFLFQSIVMALSKDGKIQKVIDIFTDISFLKMKIDHSVSMLSRERPCYYFPDGSDKYFLLDNDCSKKLSVREQEILHLIAEGHDTTAIAETLYISPHTVKTHKKNILRKSNCNNIIEVLVQCIRQGAI